MKKTPLIKYLYTSISTASVLVIIDTFILHPFANIAALVTLLIACYYIGKYGK